MSAPLDARRRRPARRLRAAADDDPLSGVANFFDLGLVFALGLLLAQLGLVSPTDPAAPEDADAPQASASPTPPSPSRARPLTRFRASTERGKGAGQRLGVAWRLDSGEVVYVPEGQQVLGDGRVVPAPPVPLPP